MSPYLPITVGNIKKYSLQEYRDNGLVKIWESKYIKHMANEVISSTNFGNTSGNIPNVWVEKDISIDLYKEHEKLFF